MLSCQSGSLASDLSLRLDVFPYFLNIIKLYYCTMRHCL